MIPPISRTSQHGSTLPDTDVYISLLLELYINTPGTLGRKTREDRRLAARLHLRGVPLTLLEKAFVITAARRCLRPPGAQALAPIRSMHYFVPVIEEVLANPPDDGYVEYLRAKLKSLSLPLSSQNHA